MPDLKALLGGPKKARTALLCGLVALATLIAVIVYTVYALGNGPQGDVPPPESEAASAAPTASLEPDPAAAPTQILAGTVPALTIDEARALALAEAGVSEEEAEVSREALAQDNGLWVYEFRFRTAGAQYEYKLNANTGEVRSLVKETFVYPSPEPPQTAVPSGPAEAGSASPAPAQASSPPAQSVPPSPVPSSSPAPSRPASMYIGADRAKAIALERAGLTAAQVTFTQVSMDRDDGRMVYEIEFLQGRTEHEFEIDAATGRILDYETDTD